MSGWLAPDAFVAAARRDDLLRADRASLAGDAQALSEALADDPRRLVVLVGDGASRLAFELARAAPRAFYPDPLRDAHDALDLGDVRGRPVVVLDGPSLDHALRPLESLLSHRLHPRLLVVVPVDAADAPRIPVLAGGYPRASIIVVTVASPDDARAPAPEELDDALLPFVLLGRAESGRHPGEDALRARGLVSPVVDGRVCALIPERARRALVGRATAEQLRAVAQAARNHREALVTLLRHTDDDLDDQRLDALAPRHARELVDPAALGRRAIAVSPRVLDRIASWAERLLAAAEDGDDAAIALEVLAREASRRGEQELAVDRLRQAEQRAVDPHRRARLIAALAVAAGEAVDPEDAKLRALRAAELEDGRGALAHASAARMQAAAIARATDRPDEAIALALRVRDDRLLIGDVRGAIRAAQLVVSLYVESGERNRALALTTPTLESAEQIDDATSVGYLRWVLGALADGDADPTAAAAHYARAIAAYDDGGAPVPERLIDSLRAARATSGEGADPAPDAREERARRRLT